MESHVLVVVIMLIATAVFVVALFKKMNLSPVLGYLVAGALIGDNGFNVVTYEQTSLLGELGVVFLLFAIGLELSIERLKAMRRYVFGLGSLQVTITGVIIAGAVILMTGDNNSAIIISGGLALSSTAIVMQVINETKSQSMQVGRIALAILLLQDFVVVPLLVIVPILGSGEAAASLPYILGNSLLKAVLALGVIFVAGRVLLRPLFSFISSDNEGSELPIAVTLLVVLTASWGTEHFGLSLALGAFVSGVLVAETDFRGKAEESIHPFKSLLLGLFFMSVGMKIDVWEMYAELTTILTLCFALITLKALIITGLCILFGFNKGVSFHAGMLLAQGGEFAFILFGLGKEHGVLDEGTSNILLLVVTCSMALTPLLAMLGQKFAERIERGLGRTPTQIIEYGARDLANHTIIAGFGKVGKMVAKVLEAEGINYIALDANDDIVRDEIANGLPVFKGDASLATTLEAVGAERALTIVVAVNNEVTVKKISKLVNSKFGKLDIIVRLKSLKNSTELYNSGVNTIIPQDCEMGLQLGSAVLKSIGISEYEINRVKTQFRSGNYVVVKQDDTFLEAEEDE
ncbi:cation:proton antiporter [Rickettsiaceae bacterium]|nr:cation:proton antiporter [Rickettsiaceae bacterium]